MTFVPTETPPAESRALDPLVLLRGLAGAVAGGIAGYFLFWVLARSGMLGYMIPGALLGLGAGYAARGRSPVLGVICAVLAVGLTLFAAWHVAFQQFTFPEFLGRLHQLPISRIVLMSLGVVMAYWLGQGR
jgi:hypothetical protein